MESRIVIVAYKPKPGKEQELRQLALDHYYTNKNKDLVTDRIPVLMQAKDGTIVEVFEWKSRDAIEKAHSNKSVLQMWEQYNQVCDYIPIGSVEESSSLFSEFTPVS